MTPFTVLTSIAAPLRVSNVDTDQIIPARFLRHNRSEGYGQFLFHDQRFDENGQQIPDFVLNRPEFRHAQILLAGDNFGSGSSREGAVFALQDHGIRCVIAPSFGQIFYRNCFNNGVLPAIVQKSEITRLVSAAAAGSDHRWQVDLEEQTISVPQSGTISNFEVEPFFRELLLKGVAELGLTLELTDTIKAFEKQYLEEFAFLKEIY
jgi:3-isopropylmalate/(R)-2-methylmalate dehydratase small subunit